MLIVHHLENSRSQRILWLLEELGLDYEIKHYKRDKKTNLAPKSLFKVHPLGKSPVLEDNGAIYAETGAIIEHIIEAHGGGRLAPSPGTDEYRRYHYWMHAAEGSYAATMMLALFVGRIEGAPVPFFAKPIARRIAKGIRDAYLDHTAGAQIDFVDATLNSSPWLAGAEISGADIIMSFPLETSMLRIDKAAKSAAIKAYVSKIHERPAYQRALEKGGPYAYA